MNNLPNCRLLTLAIASVLGLSSLAFAQTGVSLLSKPFEKGQVAELEVSHQWQSTGSTSVATDSSIGLQILDAQGRWQITQDDLGLTLGAQTTVLSISKSSTLPDSLVDQSLALGFKLGQISDWQVSTILGIGYNGRSPYGDSNANYGKADLIFSRQTSDTSSWQLILDYDGNRSFLQDIPLPTILYSDWSNEQFAWTLGFPYSSFTWQPTDKCALEVGALLIYNVHVRASYDVNENLEMFASYVNRTDAFRGDNNDPSTRRVIFSQQSVELGLRWQPCNEFNLTVAGGYAFDQQFEYGFDVRDPSRILDVSDEPFVRLAAEFKF